MTNCPVDGAPAASEEAFEIDLVNKWTGMRYPRAGVLSENTMGQILEEYAEDLDVDPKDYRILFENRRTRESTLDSNMAVEGLELREGDALVFDMYCGGVA